MKKLFALGFLAVLGALAWTRRTEPSPRVGLTFQVALRNLTGPATTWNAWWWDGASLVFNVRGPRRPVSESALFQNVGHVPGSFVLAEVTFEGLPYQTAVTLPSPVDGATYALDWAARTLTRIS